MKEFTAEMLNELKNNQEFIEKMREVESADEAFDILTEYGMELTREEFDEGTKQAISFFEEKGYFDNDELSEESLSTVAGGLRTSVANVGLGMEVAGLGLMMSGPVGWGALALLGTGFLVAGTGILMPSKKSKKTKR